jgi:tRNA(Arg) A34 adenosine deaminase TadA
VAKRAPLRAERLDLDVGQRFIRHGFVVPDMITGMQSGPETTDATEAADPDVGFLRRAIALATDAAGQVGSGPFGSVVVHDGTVVGEGCNEVVRSSDPTAHAEVVALRAAARRLGTHLLEGCVVYASCEPCPMCLAAAFWSRVDRIVFAATRHDAAAAGFDDAELYAEMVDAAEHREHERTPPVTRLLSDEAGAPFAVWEANADRVPY